MQSQVLGKRLPETEWPEVRGVHEGKELMCGVMFRAKGSWSTTCRLGDVQGRCCALMLSPESTSYTHMAADQI